MEVLQIFDIYALRKIETPWLYVIHTLHFW